MRYKIIPNETKFGIVKAVHDGDSIKVEFEDKEVSWIRLYGCDAPEVISNYVTADQPHGRKSGNFLRELIKGEKVKVETLFRDQFNRMICKVTAFNEVVPEGYDLTIYLIDHGQVWWLNEPSMNDEEKVKLRTLHEIAKNEKLGLWGEEGRKLRPSTWRSRNRRFSLEKEFEDLW